MTAIKIFGTKKVKWFISLGLLDYSDLTGARQFIDREDAEDYMKKMFLRDLEVHVDNINFDEFLSELLRIRMVCFE